MGGNTSRVPAGSCDRPYRKHIATLLRCTDPRGAMSCGSPMPRGEQIAKPAERGTRLAGPFFPASHGLEQLALDTPSGRHNPFSLPRSSLGSALRFAKQYTGRRLTASKSCHLALKTTVWMECGREL